jgi:hypothetical protein
MMQSCSAQLASHSRARTAERREQQITDLELPDTAKDLADGRRPKGIDDVQHDGLAP